ncbi:MAG: hypothetical protein EBQ58_08325 [Betaproteobacteria bacterium]|nr:hypothetical protein [Betaproteobacteria bacterium]
MTIPIHNEHSSREDDHKAAILFAARGCFAQKRFFATSVSDIQKAARTSPWVNHEYFFNKKELPLDITRQNLGVIAFKVDDIFDVIKTRESFSLKEILKALVSYVEELTFETFFEKIGIRPEHEFSELQHRGLSPQIAHLKNIPSASFSNLISGFIVQRLFLGERRLNANHCVNSIAQAFNQPEALQGS